MDAVHGCVVALHYHPLCHFAHHDFLYRGVCCLSDMYGDVVKEQMAVGQGFHRVTPFVVCGFYNLIGKASMAYHDEAF